MRLSGYAIHVNTNDRLCTQLERQFRNAQFERMLADVGFNSIAYSDLPIY